MLGILRDDFLGEIKMKKVILTIKKTNKAVPENVTAFVENSLMFATYGPCDASVGDLDGDEVYVSENGESCEAVHKGNSPVKSDGFVPVNVDNAARYVKTAVKGNTVNGWSRISEVEIYGSEK